MTFATQYQPIVRVASGPFHGASMVGVNSMAFGWDANKSALPPNLMGFAVRRTDFDRKRQEIDRIHWLNGLKRFRSDSHDLGEDVRSDQAPFQRFRWSDYTLNPEFSYRYEVFPMCGAPGSLERADPLVFDIRPSPAMADGVGIYANRSVTAAMAYLNRFKNKHPSEVPDGSAYRWLERGLKQSLLDFIANAKQGEALHVCIYELFDRSIVSALKAAKKRAVNVHIIYHAKKSKAAKENNHIVASARIKGISTPRNKISNISHNKFIVRLNGSGKPTSLWTASANFSENAFYYQTNLALVFENPDIASVYEQYFQILRKDPATRDCKDQVIELNASVAPIGSVQQIMFSPVRSTHVLDAAVSLIGSAKSAVFMSAPFGVGGEIIDAFKNNNNDILEYGLANSTAKKRIEGLRHRNTRFFTPSKLKTYMGRKWDAKAFGAHKIHAKTLIIDPWSDNPAVLIGSANFSEGSCKSNDENTLLIRGDSRLTSIITTEFLRMYDHYKIRYWINKMEEQGSSTPMFLHDKPRNWIDIYYRKSNRSRKFRDRIVFAGST